MKALFTLLLTVFVIVSSLYAQPGSIDSSFGENGTVLQRDITGTYYEAHSRFNGKILVANVLFDTTAFITQFSHNGVEEKTIQLASADIQGTYVTKKGTYKIVKASVAGNIYAVGDMYNSDETIVFIAAFNKDGSPDSSFGRHGVVQYHAGNFPGALQLIIQPDNKLLLSVNAVYDAVPTFTIPTLIRYLPDGKPDNTFGTNGVQRFVMSHTNMQLQRDGKIVLSYGYKNMQLSRRNADGSLDSTFGTNGTANFGVPYFTSTDDIFRLGQMTIQPNNKILAVGEGEYYFTCTRFTADGRLDSTFGENGSVHTSSFATAENLAILPAVIQDGGKIIIGGKTGRFYPPAPDTSFLVRLNKNGSLDKQFGNKGYVQYIVPQSTNIACIALQQDGKILTCGSQSELDEDGNFVASHPFITRYNGDAQKEVIANRIAAKPTLAEVMVNVYPNPANNILHIYSKEKLAMSLTNAWGKTVWTGKVNGNMTVNVSAYPAGVYFLSSPQQVTQKVVINH